MTLVPVSTGDPHVAAHNEERGAINDLQEEIPLLIPKPASAQVGDMLRYNGTEWVSSVTRLFEGEGQPEGVVAAPIGSRYIDTAGSDGAVEWLKVSGIDTSNVGWMLLAGDTGWRNVSASVLKRGTAEVYTAMIRRVNDHVDVYFDMAMPTNNDSPWMFLNLPSGFRPDFTRYGALQDNKEGAASSTSAHSSGDLNLYGVATGNKRDRFNGTWLTNDPWPSVLPGSPG